MFTPEDFNKLNCFDDIKALSPTDFEWFSKFLLEERWHTNCWVTPARFDWGVDVESTLNWEKVCTQSKRWNKASFSRDYVPVKEVRALRGSMEEKWVKKGIMIATLKFHPTAIRTAKALNIELIDDKKIIEIMQRVNPDFWKTNTNDEIKINEQDIKMLRKEVASLEINAEKEKNNTMSVNEEKDSIYMAILKLIWNFILMILVLIWKALWILIQWLFYFLKLTISEIWQSLAENNKPIRKKRYYKRRHYYKNNWY